MPQKSTRKKPTRPPLHAVQTKKAKKVWVKCLGYGAEHWFWSVSIAHRRCQKCEAKLHKYNLSKWECGALEYPHGGGEKSSRDF